MEIRLYVNVKMEDGSWDLFLEKELELECIPNVKDEISDNGLNFIVRSRIFYLEGHVTLSLDQEFEMINDNDKKEVLTRMKKSGWYYRDKELFDILEL
ncbi:MAG: hypothetical protein PHQ17_03105 [Methanobacterium sp.]|nr:hypothetical protein [Methanobacterium sp.]